MAHWMRFEQDGETGFGLLRDGVVHVHQGDLFAAPQPTGRSLAVDAVRPLMPCTPSKVIALWNNFHALAAKLQVALPEEPLYLLKAGSSLTDPGATIRRPASYSGRIVFEGELGIVIGRACHDATEVEAAACIFGYTCVNDVTAADIIGRDPTFPQWARAKGFDGFGPFGPAIATGLRPEELRVRLLLDGQERQNFPIADMVFSPARLVSLLSRDMTLSPGDLICCGTSVGVGSIKGPRSRVDVLIEGIGTLSNAFEL
ncbi:MAG TPA: fumarylacetoacetate hydrolase family protein [Crenalkalicoccus sp.]|nr:fumarylacetoacetate hydrolase family protein [Crenalkalicoccus sp.]